MNLNREELIQKRDTEFASLMDKLKAENREYSGKELAEQVERIHDLVLTVDMNKDLDNRVTDKRLKGVYGKLMQVLETKHIRTLVLVFIAGIIITLIPTLLYISSLKDNTPKFQFHPNATAERKPVYVQVLKTQEETDKIKQSSIIDAKRASIGAVITKEGNGLILIPKEETEPPIYSLKELPDQKDKLFIAGGIEWIPNAIYSSKIQTQIIDTEVVLEQAKKIKNLASRELLGIGAGVSCPKKNYCHVTGEKTLEKLYTVIRMKEEVVPISEL